MIWHGGLLFGPPRMWYGFSPGA